MLVLSFASCSDKSDQWSKEMKNLVIGKCSLDYQRVNNLPDSENLITIFVNNKVGYRKIMTFQKKIISKYEPQEFMGKFETDGININLEIESYLK
jgi:hypothetical protein